jgi:3D (Asp-Asp-Asp) domain-containing protein
MSQVKTRSLTSSPHALRRNRLLLIGSVVTVLPAAAFMPSVLTRDRSHTPLLAAVDEMTSIAKSNADANENAVRTMALMPPAGSALSFSQPRKQPWIEAFAEGPTASAAPPNLEWPPVVESTPDVRWFNGRPVRPARTMSMLVTAYSPDAASCGESADGITASGYSVWTNGMKLVAADTSLLPFGTLISVPGYDDASIVPVLDRGGAIKGHRLDVLYPTDAQAQKWGAQRLQVTVWEYADGLPGDFEVQRTASARE